MAPGLLDKLLSLVFENSCLICSESSQNNLVCTNCKDELSQQSTSYVRNLKHITVYSYGFYGGKLRQSILNFKNNDKNLSVFFSGLLTQHWLKLNNHLPINNIMVIPVPSHLKRIKERGYCHTTLIAKGFAQTLSYNFSNSLIKRKRHTKHMNKLKNKLERYNNVEEAFDIIGNIHTNTNLVVIDDILTSGATMQEIAKTLLKHNPHIKITGLTIACGDKFT